MRHIIGQDGAIEILQGALRAGRLHHAWIFHGPTGVGKRTTAEALAAVLLDPDASPNLAGMIEADPQGRTAHLIAAGTHPDVHVISRRLAEFSSDPEIRRRKQTNISVGVVREFIVEPAARSGQGHAGSLASKVFIIDEAEYLAVEGQNALLKTLEEPPPGTVLILITANEDVLEATIRSRCQRVAFSPLDDAAMEQWMNRAGITVDAAQRRWLLRFAEGAPGLAAQAMEHGLYDWFVLINPMICQIDEGGFPVEIGAVAAKLIETYAAAKVKANPNASKEAANRDAADFLFVLLAREVSERLNRTVVAGNDPDGYLAVLDLIHEAEGQLDSHLNVGQVLENLFIQWANLFDPVVARAGIRSH